MHIRQEVPAAQFAAARPGDALATNAVPLFEGQMTVRIHEADGTPYEHVLEIKGPAKRYEVPFNTKYKRVRRNTKRFQARQAAAAAAAQGDQEAQEAIGLIDLGSVSACGKTRRLERNGRSPTGLKRTKKRCRQRHTSGSAWMPTSSGSPASTLSSRTTCGSLSCSEIETWSLRSLRCTLWHRCHPW